MEEIKKNMVNSNTFSQMLNEKKDNLVNKNGKVLNLDTDVLDINNYNYEDQIGYKENNQNAYDRLKDAFNFKKTNMPKDYNILYYKNGAGASSYALGINSSDYYTFDTYTYGGENGLVAIKKESLNKMDVNSFQSYESSFEKDGIKYRNIKSADGKEVYNYVDFPDGMHLQFKNNKLVAINNYYLNSPVDSSIFLDNQKEKLIPKELMKDYTVDISNSFSDLVTRKMSYSSIYLNYVESKKKNSDYYEFMSKWEYYFKNKDINVDRSKILYCDNDSVYLDNGLILTKKGNSLSVKDYSSNIDYEYVLSKNNYVLNSFTLNNGDKGYLKFDYSNNNLVIKDLSKYNENEQVIFDGNDNSRGYYKSEDDVNKISSITPYIDSYGNESLYLSNGYLIRLGEDGLKVMDRVDQLTEIAERQVENGSTIYREWFNNGHDVSEQDWCAIFISWLYSELPGDETFFNKGGADSNNKGQSGAGDIPRRSVGDKKIPKYGEWLEDEDTDSNTKPMVGDIVLFDPKYKDESGVEVYYPYSDDGYPKEDRDRYTSSHVGYVYDVDDDYIYVIAGNTNNGDNDKSLVSKKKYSRKNDHINGYYRPYYNK